MPLVTATPKGLQNGNIITEFTDTTNLSAVTYTYPTQQTSLVIENSGEKDIFVTVGSYTDQLIQADKKWKVDTPFTSFSIKSNVNSQEFIATAIYKSVEDFASLTAQVSLKADKTYVDLVKSGTPKIIKNTLAELNAAYPTGSTDLALVTGNVKEVASLTISTIPTTAGNVTVTLNGVATNIAVDPATETTTALVATKIRNTVFPNGAVTGGAGSTVTFTASTGGVKTDATYSAGSTGATGTMTTTTQGVDPDGNWYYWNGSAWTAGVIYQGTGINDYSVGRRKLTNYVKADGYNLIDISEITTGGYYNTSGVFVTNSGWGTTPKLPIVPNTKYYYTYAIMSYFDSSGIFISQAGATPHLTPSNVSYAIASIQVANYNNAFIQKGIISENKPTKYTDKSLLVTGENVEDLILLDNGRYIKKTRTSNLFDKSKAITNGYFNTSGAFVGSSTTNSTHFIPVTEGSTYSHLLFGNTQFWDDDFNFISNIVPASTFVIPAGAKKLTSQYAVANKDGVAIALGSTIKYEGYYDYKIDNAITASSSKLKFKQWNAMGDSITAGVQYTPNGYMYMQWIKDLTGVNFTNYGISGTALAKRPGMPEYDANTMSVRYTDMSDNADYITVFGGTNDIGSVVGTMADRTVDTLYGACHVLYNGLLTKYPGKKIGLITPIRYTAGDTSRLQIVNVIKEVASYYNLPVCDLYNSLGMLPALNDSIKAIYCTDGLHLSEEGHKFIATKIQAFLESL